MASLAKCDFRIIFYYNFKHSLTTKVCFVEIIAVFKNDCLSLRTIERWYQQFKHGLFLLDDDPRPGQPVEVSTLESMAAVQKAIEEDQRMTYRQLEELLNIPVSTLHHIINEHLQVRKLCMLWVPHSLSEEQQQCRVNWCRQMLKNFDLICPRR